MSKTFFWDLETGGRNPEVSSILSSSTLQGNQSTSFFARPTPGTGISKWAVNNVWNRQKKRKDLLSEEQLLTNLLGTFQQNQGATFAGWNIGTNSRGIGGFDVNFLLTRASRYNLQTDFQKALSGVTIRDVGQEKAYELSKALYPFREQLDEDLWRSVETYRNVGMAFETQGYSEKEAAKRLAGGGYKLSGWKQEDLYGLLTGKTYSSHQSESDIRALSEIIDTPIPSTPEFASQWNKLAVKRRTVSSILSGAPAWDNPFTFYQSQLDKASKYGISGIEDLIKEEASVRGASLDDLRAGKGFQEMLEKVGGKSGSWKLGINYIKKHPFAIGGIGLVGAALLTKPLNAFSGKDDEYNTIEGLGHTGLSCKRRQEQTDFGSGYRGLLQSKSFRIGAGLLAGATGLAYGIHKLHPDDKEKHYDNLRSQFAGYASALSRYGVKVGTGHKRILIPKTNLSEGNLEELGFQGTLFAIPEAGQDKLTSYRNIYNPYHLHSHGDYWSMHKDRNAAITMSIKRVFADDDPFLVNVGQALAEVPAGLAHIATEGIPGAYYWLKNRFTDNTDMAEKIRQEQGLRFSGKDDDYNTIEGLRHGGTAQELRKQLTDFGSGWVRRAISKGIELEKIAAASRQLGKKLHVKTTNEGTRWLVGKKLGAGGKGSVYEAFEEGTGKAGIYKHVGLTKELKEQETHLLYSPAFEATTSVTNMSTHTLTSTEATRTYFEQNYIVPTGREMTETARKYGGFGALQEASIQKIARETYGGIVPEVYGISKTGFFTEQAGQKLLSQEEKVKGIEWLKESWLDKQIYRRMTPKLSPIHLDPHVGNIMKKGDKYMMIDWGGAAVLSPGKELSRETRLQAEEAFEKYLQIEKEKLKLEQASLHQKAMEDLAKNSLRPGRGHTQATGKIVK